MIPHRILSKYPHAARFLQEHPDMNIDQAINFLSKEIRQNVK